MQASVGLFKTMTGKERAGTQACNTSPIMTPSMQASSSPPADPLRINLASYLLLGSLFIMLYKGLHACCWLPIRRRHCSAPSPPPSRLPLALTRPALLPGAALLALPPRSVLLSFLLLPPRLFQEPRRTGRRRALACATLFLRRIFFTSNYFLYITDPSYHPGSDQPEPLKNTGFKVPGRSAALPLSSPLPYPLFRPTSPAFPVTHGC